MKFTNEEILHKLELDLAGAKSSYNQIVTDVNNWKAEIDEKYAIGENTSTAARNKSQSMMWDIKRAVEGSIPSLSEPFVSDSDIVVIESRNAQGVERARMLQQLLNKQFSRGLDVVDFIEELSRDIQEEGTIFIKSGWKDDSPTVEKVDINELIVDPSARTLKDAKFVIQRRKVSVGDILGNPGWYGEHTLEQLKVLMPTSDSEYDAVYNELGSDTSFNFDDKARELVEIFEFYGIMDIDDSGIAVPVLGIWSGSSNYLLKFEESPYPASWNGIPFDVGVYIKKTGHIYGESITTLIGDYQKIRTGFMREIINNANQANSSQTAVRKGSMDIANKRKFLMGEHYEYLGTEPGIVPAQFNEVPMSIFNLLEQFKIEEEELSGIGRQNAGSDLSKMTNKTATAANISQTNADRRLLQIVRHMTSMFEGMFKKWIDLNQMMLEEGNVNAPVDEEDRLRLGIGMGPRDGQGPRAAMMMTIDRGMIQGRFDLKVQVTTSGAKTSQNQNVLLMLQQMTPYMGTLKPGVPLQLLAKLADNTDQPGLAQELRQTAEQMNKQSESGQLTFQEQLVQEKAQLEAAKLESEISKNDADAMKKQAESVGIHVETELATYGIETNID